MNKNPSTVMLAGLLLIVLGVAFNPWKLGPVLDAGGSIRWAGLRVAIWIGEALCVGAGLWMVLNARSERAGRWLILMRNAFAVLAVTFIFLEALLRLGMGLLPMSTRNLILTKYNCDPDGIYFYDPGMMIPVLKPDFTQNRMFYNGHQWRHNSDHFGIRDDRDFLRAEIVAVGDSMIYGHGVDLEQTVCRAIEKKTGLRVANLGTQGDYPLNEYIRLKQLGLFYRPRVVLFFVNGHQDEVDFVNCAPTEMRIDKVLSDPAPEYARGIAASGYLKNYRPNPQGKYYLGNYSVLYRAVCRVLELQRKLRRASGAASFDKKRLENDLRKLLVSAKKLSEANGAKFVVVCNGRKTAGADRFNDLVKTICVANAIPCLDLNDRSFRAAYFLKRDGHYSPAGSDWAAAEIVGYLRFQGIV